MYLGPPRRVAINRSTSPIMQTIATDPIEMKGSAAMTCPTKRRNSPIASHFGEKASPQRVGAPATGPPNPAAPTTATGPPKPGRPDQSNMTTQTRQARPKQQDRPNQSSPEQSKAAPNKAKAPPKPQQQDHPHPNPAAPTKATGPPKPKQPRTKQKPHQNHSSTNHSNRTTQTRQPQPQQQDHPNPAAPTKATGPPKPKQPRPQLQDHPNPGRAASTHHRNLGKVRETVRRAVLGTGTPLLLHGAFDRESDRSGTVAVVQVVNAFHQHIALRAVPYV